MNVVQAASFKTVAMHGLPNEDGSYLIIMNGESRVAKVVVRFTESSGARNWISPDREFISEDQIVMYQKIVITPTNFGSH
jgi:hypothetical protein